jgi:hypothetical protein
VIWSFSNITIDDLEAAATSSILRTQPLETKSALKHRAEAHRSYEHGGRKYLGAEATKAWSGPPRPKIAAANLAITWKLPPAKPNHSPLPHSTETSPSIVLLLHSPPQPSREEEKAEKWAWSEAQPRAMLMELLVATRCTASGSHLRSTPASKDTTNRR